MMILRYIQFSLILVAGFFTTAVTIPGNLTGVIFLLFGLALAYQYNFFKSYAFQKITIILLFYSLTIISNVFFINKLKIPYGFPSILVSLTTVYLFWMIFSEEIRHYLIRTHQLKGKLEKVEVENTRLEGITEIQAMELQRKNMVLERSLREKTAVEKELRETLAVKNFLLQEVHHRVKNNLSLIISLLNLQQTDNPVIRDFINSNSNRLYAMAAVHETIYQTESYESVDLAGYFYDILDNLLKIYAGSIDVKTEIFMDNIDVSIDTAIPLGIIYNDCLNNSLLHGVLRQTKNKTISISLKKKAGIELVISDDDSIIDPESTDINFSNRLISILVVDQLGGTLRTEFSGGNRWIVVVP